MSISATPRTSIRASGVFADRVGGVFLDDHIFRVGVNYRSIGRGRSSRAIERGEQGRHKAPGIARGFVFDRFGGPWRRSRQDYVQGVSRLHNACFKVVTAYNAPAAKVPLKF